MENNRKLSASCVVIKDNEILLVKHILSSGISKTDIGGEGLCIN